MMKSRDLRNASLAVVLIASVPATGAFAQSSLTSQLPAVDQAPHSGAEHEDPIIIHGRPDIDLAFQFRDGSAVIGGELLAELDRLGKALSGDSELKGAKLVIVGYAEAARHSARKALAMRRAEAVKHYLISNYPLNAADLVTAAVIRKPGDPCCVRVINIADETKDGATLGK